MIEKIFKELSNGEKKDIDFLRYKKHIFTIKKIFLHTLL